jgi:hypothetical protein
MTELWTRALRQRMIGLQIGSGAGQAGVSRAAASNISSVDRMTGTVLERHDRGDVQGPSHDAAGGSSISGRTTDAVATGGSGGATRTTGGAGTTHMIPV